MLLMVFISLVPDTKGGSTDAYWINKMPFAYFSMSPRAPSADFTMSLSTDPAQKWGLHRGFGDISGFRPVWITRQWWIQPMKRKANDPKSWATVNGFRLNSLRWKGTNLELEGPVKTSPEWRRIGAACRQGYAFLHGQGVSSQLLQTSGRP